MAEVKLKYKAAKYDEAVEKVATLESGKVDNVTGKGLSSNDYTDAEKAAVATISGKQNQLSDTQLANIDKGGTALQASDMATVNGQSLTSGGNIVIEGGGGGEPSAYIKDASVSGNTLTLTKKDDSTVEFTPSGGGTGGTTDYNDLSNKPQIGGTALSGNKALSDLGIAAESHTHDADGVTFDSTKSSHTAGSVGAKLSQIDLKVGELNDLDDSVKETEGGTTLVSAINKAAQMGGGSSTDGETVRIVLTASVEGVSVAGKTIYMYLNDTASNPEVLTTDDNGMVAKKVPTDYKYRLVFPDIEGCDSIPDVVHTAVLRERSIEVEYKAASPDKEAVTIYCRKYEQGVNGVYAGKVVKVTIGTQTAEYTTDSNGKVAIEIVTGTTYTVSTDPVDDYYLHGEYSHTFTASKTQRHIYFDFHNTGIGLFLVDNNGAEYTYDEWVASGNDGSTAVAIKFATSPLISNGGVYYILLDDVVNKSYVTKYKWCDQNVQFNNIPLNGNNVNAEFYYNGKGATAAIIDEASNRGLFVDAASFCNGKSKQLGNGQTLNGFLYSVGQDRVIAANIMPLDALFALVRPNSANNFTTLMNTVNWTSTQYIASDAYYAKASFYSGAGKLNPNCVLVAYA